MTPPDVAALRAEVKAGQPGAARRIRRARQRQTPAPVPLRPGGRRFGPPLERPALFRRPRPRGGGRLRLGELYPASDIDLLILLPEPPDAKLQARLEQLVGLSGISAWKSATACAPGRMPGRSRPRHHGPDLAARIPSAGREQEALRRFRQDPAQPPSNPSPFSRPNAWNSRKRYLRFNETAYSLEPNCKDSPGGLRDLQVIFWVAQAAGYGTSWSDLERHGFLTREEMQHAESCEEYLRHLRIRLHFLVNRREDRLLFDYQNTWRPSSAFQPTEAKRASEQLMQGYYRNAKAVTGLNTILLQNIGAALYPKRDQTPQVIDDNFQAVTDLLDVRDDTSSTASPRPFSMPSWRCRNPRPEGHDGPYPARPVAGPRTHHPEFRADPVNRANFIKLFQSRRGIVH